MRFPPDFIERVTESNNIVDIISQYTQLKPVGGGLMGRCPFPDHPEKTPSFSVSEMKQVYNCFGCHKKGNIFKFLQDYNGMSFPEAVEYLAGRAHIALPELPSGDQVKQDAYTQKKKQMASVNRYATEYFYNQFKKLPEDHPAKQYTQKRGLTAETIETFKIGYSTEDWDGIIRFFESKAIPLSLVEEARLIKARSGGKTGFFDLFRERLMFPIFSTMSEPIAFGGRIITQGEPKYLNSPETPVFHKGKVLYGLSQTAKFIRAQDQVIIVEGYMDLISLYQAGIQNVVATMGTALTAEHGKMISRLTKNVVVLFDGDSAGQDASERSLPILLAAGLHPRGLTLPDGQDPDDFVKAKGAEALRDLVNNAEDHLGLVLSQWMKGYKGEAAEKVSLADKLIPVFISVQDVRLRQLYLKAVSERMRVDERWLAQALIHKKQSGFQQATPAISAGQSKVVPEIAPSPLKKEELEPKISLKGMSKAETLLLSLVLKNREHWIAFAGSGVQQILGHAGLKTLLEKAASIDRQAPEKFDKLTSLLIMEVDLPDALFATGVNGMLEGTVSDEEAKLLQDCLLRIRDQHLKNEADRLTQEMKNSKDPEKLQRFMQIQKERMTMKIESKADQSGKVEK
jgi:DNA primase